QPSSSDRNHCNDSLYARVVPKILRTDRTARKTLESTESVKIKYTTIQHGRHDESDYENLTMQYPYSATR
ncbi:hypothetical protein M9458_000648, partial [Cirrhinus mrigala]